LFNIQMLI